MKQKEILEILHVGFILTMRNVNLIIRYILNKLIKVLY